MFSRSRTRFHDKNWQKRGASFFLCSFESFDQECVIGPKVTNIHYGYKQYIEDKSILYSVIQLSDRVYNVTFPALAAES
jgi:hypothetical protein